MHSLAATEIGFNPSESDGETDAGSYDENDESDEYDGYDDCESSEYEDNIITHLSLLSEDFEQGARPWDSKVDGRIRSLAAAL